ncbi:hypothetical protein HELRODRAFT_77671, partial [Helobdella robusta]|uniref:Uncharacterized protein n=1 Tax=Helobdella robusta TaxID=6412 RepID=T1G320_HELRO
LSNDVKLFYTMCNGFQLKWSYKLIDTSVPVSDCRINSVENLKKLTISSKYNNCFDPSEIYLSCNDHKNSLKFTDHKLFFELDSCEGYSKVCLVFNKPNYKINNHFEPQCSVWLVDRSLSLHYLTDSFTSYMALMMSHCAIKQWQYAFTEIGLPPQTRVWDVFISLTFGFYFKY